MPRFSEGGTQAAERKQIEEIKEQKLERWAMRLKGETADGEREGVLLDKSAN